MTRLFFVVARYGEREEVSRLIASRRMQGILPLEARIP